MKARVPVGAVAAAGDAAMKAVADVRRAATAAAEAAQAMVAVVGVAAVVAAVATAANSEIALLRRGGPGCFQRLVRLFHISRIHRHQRLLKVLASFHQRLQVKRRKLVHPRVVQGAA